MRLSDISVGARIYSAFGALVALLGLVGMAGYIGVSTTSGIFDSYRAAARQTLEVEDYVADVASMRLAFLNYLVDPSVEEEDQLVEWIKDVATTDADGLAFFEDSPEDIETIAQVTEQANLYLDSFEKLLAARKSGDVSTADTTIAEMRERGPHIYDLLVGMGDRAEEKQNTLGPMASEMAHFQVAIVLATSGFGALVGIVAAFVTGRWLSGAIKGMTQSMRSLADGDIDQAISGTGPNHELGHMARALEVFQKNAHEVRTAEAEKDARSQQSAARARMMEDFQKAFDTVIDATAAGDFNQRIDVKFNDPDIDRISANFNTMLEAIKLALGEAGQVLGSLASADLTRRMEGKFKGAFSDLQNDTNAVADKLAEIVTQLRDTSSALKLATGEILAGANDLSERTTKQAATIEETSAAMEQLASTVTRNAQRAIEASQSANKIALVAEEGGEVMGQATEAMEQISASSGKISNIIGLIDDIAFQTNLLALNASVEAARAGDAGKGFAVVAVEVRRLAQSAASASSEVKVLIDQSAQEVKNGSQLVASAAAKLNSMLVGVRSNTGLMDGIANDSKEQASGIQEVSIAVRQMDEMTQHNAALVEEMNAAIEQTESQANQLDMIVDVFEVDSAKSNRTFIEEATAARSSGIKALPARAKSAAKAFLSQGSAAMKQDWSEF